MSPFPRYSHLFLALALPGMASAAQPQTSAPGRDAARLLRRYQAEASGPAAPTSSSTGGNGYGAPMPAQAPATSPTQRFLRFLEGGLGQALGQPYEVATKVLRENIDTALSLGTDGLPPVLVLTVKAARDSARDLGWEANFRALQVTLRSVIERPEPFMGGPEEAFSGCLQVARLAASGTSYEAGTKILRGFGRALLGHRGALPGELHGVVLAAAVKAAQNLGWETNFRSLSAAFERLAQGVPNAGHAFEVALFAGSQGSYEHRARVLRVYLRALLASRQSFPNLATYLAGSAALEGAQNLGWEANATVLVRTVGSLRSAIPGPREYLTLALEATAGLPYEASCKALRVFVDRAVRDLVLDPAAQALLRSAREAGQNKGWDNNLRILRAGVEQARSF